MSNQDPVVIEENLGLSGSETVGVIVAVVSIATVLIIMVLFLSMFCRLLFRRRRSGGAHNISDTLPLSSPARNLSILKSPSSLTRQESVDGYSLQRRKNSNAYMSLTEESTTFTQQDENQKVSPPELQKSKLPQPRQFRRDDLMLQEKLGEGEYGPIYRGEAYGLGLQGKSKPVTVKMLSPSEEEIDRTMFNQDIEMLCSISHLNVVGLLAVCTKDSPECILLDAGLPGDLHSYICEKKKSVPANIATESETKELLRITDEISLGMAYLASERFIHKDLALRNCIIGIDGVVKIAHFGLGPLIYPEAYYRVRDTDLPIRWMSPEAITSANFTTMSDIWSFGVTVWELFKYGTLPFEGKQNDEVIDFVLQEGKLQKPVKCSSEVFGMIMTCWNADPLLRPSFHDLHGKIIELAGVSPLGPITPAQSPLSPLSMATPSNHKTPTGIGIGKNPSASNLKADTNYPTS